MGHALGPPGSGGVAARWVAAQDRDLVGPLPPLIGEEEQAAAARPAAPGGIRRTGLAFGSAPGVAGGQQAGHLGDRLGGRLEVPGDFSAFFDPEEQWNRGYR